MNHLKTILQISSPLIVLAVIYLVLNATDPATVGSVGILIVFLLIYLLFLSIIYVIIRFGYAGFRWAFLAVTKKSNLPVRRIDLRKAYYIASIVAFMPVTLLAMHSFSGLRWTDVLLVSVFAVVAIFFVIRRRTEA